MLNIIYFIIIITNLWMGNLKKRNNLVLTISFCFMIILMGLNTFNSDYLAYEDYYNMQQYGFSVEFGYALLSAIIYSFNIPYQIFLCIYFFIVLLIGACVIKRTNGNYHFCLAIYLLTAVFIDTCEIRQTMSYFLYALALTYLANMERKKYFVIILVAGLFHRSAYVFIPFGLLYKNSNKNLNFLKIYFLIINILCIIVFLNGNKIPGLKIILSLFLPQDKLEYFDTRTTYGFLLFFFANFSNIFAVYTLKKIYNQMQNSSHFLTNYETKFINVTFYSLLYLSFAMPLCMLNSEFLRYFRCSVIPVITIMSFSMTYKHLVSQNIYRFIMIRNTDFIILIYFICYTISFQHFRVRGEVLANNLLF